MSNLQNHLQTTWDWFTAPTAVLTGANERRNARLIAAFLLALMLAFLLNGLMVGGLPFFILIPLSVAYILSRSQAYKLAAFITFFSLIGSLYISLSTQAAYTISNTTNSLMWLALVFLIASLIFRPIHLLLFITTNFVGIALLPALIPGLTFQHTTQALSFLGAFCFVLLIFIRHRNLLEQDRQVVQLEIEARLRRRTAELEALRQIGLELTTNLDLEPLLKSIISQAAHFLNARQVGLFLYRPEIDGLEVVATYVPGPLQLGLIIKPGEGLAGKVWQRDETIFVSHYRQWEGSSPALADTVGDNSIIGVPIHWREQKQGVLSVVSQKGQQFTQADAELLTLLAPQVAVALQNANLWDMVQNNVAKLENEIEERNRIENELRQSEARLYQQTSQLEILRQIGLELSANLEIETLLESVVSNAIRFLNARQVALCLYRPELDKLELVAQHQKFTLLPVGTLLDTNQGVTGKAWQADDIMLVQNYRKWAERIPESSNNDVFGDNYSVIGIPLRWQGRKQGVITIISYPDQIFTKKDTELLTLFSAQVAAALQNAYLLDVVQNNVTKLEYEIVVRKRVEADLRQSEEEAKVFQEKLQILHEISIELFYTPSLDEMFRLAVVLGREKLGFDRLGILLADEEKKEAIGKYGTGQDGTVQDVREFRDSVWNPELWEILAAQKRIGFWEDAPLYEDGNEVGRGWNAMVGLWNGDRGVGWLAADNLIRQEPVTAVTLEILTLYGTTIGHLVTRKLAEGERENLIEELEAKNAELERFTYTVSHDLRSPLVTVRGFLGFLEQDAERQDWQRVRKDIERIKQATNNMEQLLRDLLELSRVGRVVNEAERVPFTALVNEALQRVQGRLAERGVKVKVEPDLPDVFVDKVRVIEVVQNLLDNAARFMGEQPDPRIIIGKQMQGNEVVLFVSDNGIGIDPKYHEKVFGLFERLKQDVEGTGIGLALVKRIIEVHNGRIWIESTENDEGSKFCFVLPMSKNTLGKAKDESQTMPP